MIGMATSTRFFWQTDSYMRHNPPMRKALPFLILLTAVALSGCSSESGKVYARPRPKIYKSIISLSPSTTEMILSDADSSALHGRTSSCNWPEGMVKRVPIVADVKPDYERVQAVHPDLIVYDNALFSKEEIDKLKAATHADTFEFSADTLDEYIMKCQDLGSKLANEMRFNDYLNRVIVEQGAASGGKFSTTPKVAIIMGGTNGSYMIAGTEGFLGNIVKVCNGDLVGPKGKNFVSLNPEELVTANPDVIIVPGTKTDLSSFDAVSKEPKFASVKAIKDKRVVPLDADVLLRKGQRVDMLIKSVHKVIAPAGQAG